MLNDSLTPLNSRDLNLVRVPQGKLSPQAMEGGELLAPRVLTPAFLQRK